MNADHSRKGRSHRFSSTTEVLHRLLLSNNTMASNKIYSLRILFLPLRIYEIQNGKSSGISLLQILKVSKLFDTFIIYLILVSIILSTFVKKNNKINKISCLNVSQIVISITCIRMFHKYYAISKCNFLRYINEKDANIPHNVQISLEY